MALIQTRPYTLQVYDPETDNTPINEIVLMVDHYSWDEPKRVGYDAETLFPDLSTATKAELLSILEVSDVVSASQLSNYVSKETGKVLVSSTELDRLSAIKQNLYTISLPASSDVSGRISGATIPSDWSISVGESDKDLLVTHGMRRRIANCTIFSVYGTEETMLMGQAGFTGLKTPDNNTLLIMGLTQLSVGLSIYITFA